MSRPEPNPHAVVHDHDRTDGSRCSPFCHPADTRPKPVKPEPRITRLLARLRRNPAPEPAPAAVADLSAVTFEVLMFGPLDTRLRFTPVDGTAVPLRTGSTMTVRLDSITGRTDLTPEHLAATHQEDTRD